MSLIDEKLLTQLELQKNAPSPLSFCISLTPLSCSRPF